MSRRRRRPTRGQVGTATVVVPPPATVAPVIVDEVRRMVRTRPAEPVWPDLSTMTVAQLRDRARELGVSLGKARTKAAIIEVLGG